MKYIDAMKYIKNCSKFNTSKSLDSTFKLLELLGNPEKNIKAIHIAGTNGKGSITAMLTEVLIQAGYKTGMYSSPFIEDFEERIQINGINIDKDVLSNLVTTISIQIDILISKGYEPPTEFQLITCIMFLYFSNSNIDYAVIETGLGGRLDSTNVIQPILSIITSISLDHLNVLGNTIEEIAFEKAGIIKPSTPVVCYPQKPSVKSIIEATCKDNLSPFIEVAENCVSDLHISDSLYQYFVVQTTKKNYDIELSLLGKYQLLNCATAIYATEQLQDLGLKITSEDLMSAMKTVKWPGRFEVMHKSPYLIIDGAHNTDGISALISSIKDYLKYDKLILIIGMLSDKSVEEIVPLIAKEAQQVITVTPNSDRSISAQDLRNIFFKYNENVYFEKDYELALKSALYDAKPKDLILICGSLYMIGDMRKLIRKKS